MNATDSGVRRLGLTAEQLHEINPRAIGVQISAFKGARPSSHSDRPGYDPLLQAATGIMTRFGSSDMPLLHGIASCVDYLTGYLGAFAAVTALQARERRGDDRGDWVGASLASAAALTRPGPQQPGRARPLGFTIFPTAGSLRNPRLTHRAPLPD
jgi:crotonobetainyl-CoA:carnitine CoA-transferase CaiB-like acyl-CoA transferase